MNPSWSLQLPLALGLACTLIASGCQDRTTRVPYIFQLSPETGAPTAAVAPAGRTPVTDPALPKHLGVVTVNIQGFLNGLTRQRRVLATIADVFYVTITVKAADGAEFSQTIEKSAISNGQTTATFSGLSPGDATVTMKAFDTNNRAIGATTTTASVAAGQNTPVSLTLTLDPTYTGGSGGGSAPTSGSLTTNATIVDGPVVDGPAPAAGVGSFSVPITVQDIDLDALGDIWALDEELKLRHYSPAGIEQASVAVESDPGSGMLKIGPNGERWFITQGFALFKYGADGQKLGEIDLPGMMGAEPMFMVDMEVASDGSLWLVGADSIGWSIFHVPTDLSNYHFERHDGFVSGITFDGQGRLWATGAEYKEIGGAPQLVAQLFQIGPFGAILERHAAVPYGMDASFNRYMNVVADDAGFIWFTDTIGNRLRRFDPTTKTVNLDAFVGWAPEQLVKDMDGRLWVSHQEGVSRVTPAGAVAETVPYDNLYRLYAGASGVWGIGIGGSTGMRVYHISH